MRKVLIDENIKPKIENLFDEFLKYKGWDGDERIKLMYCFYHTINLINSNIVVDDKNENIKFDNDLATIRSQIIEEAIEAVRSCELVAPNVRRINLDSAVGALLSLK